MKFRTIAAVAALTFATLVGLSACTVKYSFSGASIPLEATTVSIPYFPNNAPMVAPTLSSTLTDALQDKFARQTKLQLVDSGGDLAFEGEVTNYTSTPAAITSAETAAMNRLTITVKVKFTNVYEPQNNYNKSFSAFAEYDANQLLQDIQDSLITEIVEQLVQDIFNAAVANW
ncbi:MAG: LptE family protein [Tidjanibacter sp.]|nr:LptE family protein [Tidjanibacter sp.]MBQ2248290.1 LptE family protein [Tidjanibacter sp.]